MSELTFPAHATAFNLKIEFVKKRNRTLTV